MTPEEIRKHAKRIVNTYLEDGIEYCYVYEDEELAEAGHEIWEAVRSAANRIIEEIKL